MCQPALRRPHLPFLSPEVDTWEGGSQEWFESLLVVSVSMKRMNQAVKACHLSTQEIEPGGSL